jgi:hypothetical protein
MQPGGIFPYVTTVISNVNKIGPTTVRVSAYRWLPRWLVIREIRDSLRHGENYKILSLTRPTEENRYWEALVEDPT